jgi:hypothetical protein
VSFLAQQSTRLGRRLVNATYIDLRNLPSREWVTAETLSQITGTLLSPSPLSLMTYAVETLSQPRARSACRVTGLLSHGLGYFTNQFVPASTI